MKFNPLIAGLLALPMIASSNFAKAESFEARMADNSDVVLVENQIQKLKEMSEADIRLQLELQATQIETGLNMAIASGEPVTEEQKETVKELVDAIRTEAYRPKLKRRLLRKTLMFLPRVIAQGIGYLGMGLTDLIGIPLVFTTKATFSAFAAGGSGIGMGLGIAGSIATGAMTGLGELMVLGYSFPVVIGTIVPISLTTTMICSGRSPRSEYTRRFCNNWERNQDFINSAGEAGERFGEAINRLFHPHRRRR